MKFNATLLLAVTLFCGCAAHEDNNDSSWEHIKISRACFNQALLRECVPHLSEWSGVQIELSKKVKAINNLYVDLYLNPDKEYELGFVLSRIISFIEKEHGVKLKIKTVNSHHVIIEL